ncbi:hypothetical protein BO71DRAFT_463178 [Aspergillus ellipticus CBS 707.79]|uniref:Secreted protein CSS2 C-terminal domain-containing protein n=1 Tax=Aspergillus ellipticus CBS 707.79 TaxID=1448320 RepID=A0A319DQP9_9EURO|nr:hypothetical protein BO71DRAFT_463178 [Aspergillus ellipticus CBS 707.79]
MVQVSKIVCGLFACLLVDPCRAGDDEESYVITTPIFSEWEDNTGSFNMTVTLGVINADYASQWTNKSLELDKRTGIPITNIVTTVKKGAKIISTAKAALDIYEFLADVMKSKSDADSCNLNYGTELSGEYFYGYAYKATTTKTNCETTAEKKTLLSAVEKCALNLHKQGMTVGCCAFSHQGSWRGHLRLSAEPDLYPVKTVDC